MAIRAGIRSRKSQTAATYSAWVKRHEFAPLVHLGQPRTRYRVKLVELEGVTGSEAISSALLRKPSVLSPGKP